MKTVIFTPDAVPISDFEAERIAKAFAAEGDELHICNILVLNYIRLLIVKDVIDYKELTIIFEGKSFQFNEYGVTKDRQNIFNQNSDIAFEMMTLAIEKRKKRRSNAAASNTIP